MLDEKFACLLKKKLKKRTRVLNNSVYLRVKNEKIGLKLNKIK